MSNPNSPPSRSGKVIKLGVAAAILAFSYEMGNYNDTPGQFFDIRNPSDLVAAPLNDAKFLYENFETVASAGGKIIGFVL